VPVSKHLNRRIKHEPFLFSNNENTTELFPVPKRDIITCKDGTKLTVESDKNDITNFFCLKSKNAHISLYFDNGFLSMYDMNYDCAWNGTGEPLLKKIRALSRGKFPKK
jgi:hypothetical protein